MQKDFACDGAKVIHTIGHSTRTLEIFLSLLHSHRIELLVDVRRWPSSTRHPHFNREPLSSSLKKEGIDYEWREDLGGFRKPSPNSPNGGWKTGAFRAYADFMLTAEFEKILRQVETLATAKRIALTCAEALPWRCHRQLLADAFLIRNYSVRHIMNERCEEHRLPLFARAEGTKIFYLG